MMNKKIFLFLLVLLLVLFLVPFVFSQLPDNIIKIKDYNKSYAQDFLIKISIPIAFIAGILSLLSPCILPILPAFFSYTFKEKKQITRMTFIFFLGFTVVFIAFGIIGVLIGQASIVLLQNKLGIFILIAGILLIIFGLMEIFGKGFHGIMKQRKFKNNALSVFAFGLFFALGWSACLGPIISGILLMTAVIRNFFTGAYLMFFYSLGIFVPFFIFSFIYDKYNFSKSKFIAGKEIMLFNKKINTTHLLSGILLIIIGSVFIIYRNTQFINKFDPLNTKNYFFKFQDFLLENTLLFNITGVIAMLLLAYFIWRFIKKIKDGKKDKK